MRLGVGEEVAGVEDGDVGVVLVPELEEPALLGQADVLGLAALSRADVPASRKSVTTEWLTDVLCRDTPGAAVIAFRAEDVSSGTSERSPRRDGSARRTSRATP